MGSTNMNYSKKEHFGIDPADEDFHIWEEATVDRLQRQHGATALTRIAEDWGHKSIESFETGSQNGTYTLEVGCGTGRHFDFVLKDHLSRYIGLDIGFSHLKVAADRSHQVSLIQSDVYMRSDYFIWQP